MPTPFPSNDGIVAFGVSNQAPVFDNLKYEQIVLNPALEKVPYDRIPLVKGEDGSLYLAYLGEDGVVVAHQDGGVWKTIPYSLFAGGRDAQLLTDSQGVPYVSFLHTIDPGGEDEKEVLTVLTLKDGAWETVGEEPWLDIKSLSTPRITLGPDDSLYLAYNNSGDLALRHFVNGNWDSLGASTVPGLNPDYLDILIAADGTPHIAFADSNDGGRLTVMRFDGSDWSVVANPQRANVPVTEIALAEDAGGLYVAYSDSESDLYVQHFDGTTWTSLPSPRSAGMLGSSPLAYGLAIGKDGAIYLAASQFVTIDNLYVLRYADGAWTVISDSIPGARNSSIALGDDGQVYVTSTDRETGAAVVHEIDPVAQATAVTTGTAVQLGAYDPDADPLVYTITGGANQALFEATDYGIRFIKKPAEAGTYSVQLSLDDGVNHVTRMVSVTVTVPPNSAPVLDADASPKLPNAEFGGLAPKGAVGVLVSDLLGNSVSDIDDDAVGMLITGVHGGSLHYSVDGGTTWVAVTGTVSAAHALTLGADTRIYFEAAATSTGTITDALSFRAWDGTDGKSGDWKNLGGVAETIGTTDVTNARGIAAFDGYLVSIGQSGLGVIDAADIDTTVGSASSETTSLTGVAVAGNIAYAISNDSTTHKSYLLMTSLATPEQPTALGSPLDLAMQDVESPADLAAYGDTVVVAGYPSGVLVITADSDSNLSVKTRIPVENATAVALDGTRIVVGNGSNGVLVVDRSDDSVKTLSFTDIPDLGSASATDVVIQGAYAYVTMKGAGLAIADISNPAAPAWLGHVKFPSSATQVVVIDDLAYVATREDVQVVDVSDRWLPEQSAVIPIAQAVGLAQVGDKLAVTTVDQISLISTGATPSSVSKASDTVAVDIRDTIAPKLTLPTDHAAHLRGEDLSIASSEAGTVYLVKTGAHEGSPTSSELTQLVGDGKAVAKAVSNGHAVFDTDTLLGGYVVYGVDAAGNVSSGASNTVNIRTVPALTITDAEVSFTEGDAPTEVAPGLLLSDDDAAAGGLFLAYVRLVPDSPILIGGAPIGSVDASESLVLIANPVTMGGLTGQYSANEGLLTITGTGTLAQWQAALRAVQYSNTSKTPLAGRAVEITVLDTDGESIDQQTVVVEITPVDNAPVITGVPQTAQVVSVGSAAGLVHFTVADADSALLTVTLTPVNGKLFGVGVNQQGIATYTGTAQAINEYLTYAMFELATAGTGSIEISLVDGVNAQPTLATYQFTSPVVTPPVTPPTTPGVPTTPVDGVPVEVSTGTDGQQQIKIPVVTDNRDEDTSTPNSKLADIALVKTVAGTPLLNLGVPVGTGATAKGPATPVSGSAAQNVLDGGITAAAGTSEQKAAAQGFVSSLEPGTQVVVQTVTVTAQAANGGPLVINAGNLQDGHKTALIIDTRALPAGTLIDLENVDFAIIVGDARVTGGAGANVVYGDDLNQFIVLGEGDDILHGEGGTDTVGSLRGNDQTFGDDGNDVVYGGTGDDMLHGSNGTDRMNGGFGFDTGVQSGVLADYTVTLDGHAVVLTHKANGEVDRFLDVEHITFDSGTSIIVAHEAGDVAGLTARFAGAQLIELNANRAVTGTVANDDVTPELGIALNIDLGDGQDIVRLAGGRTDVHIDVEAGQRAELTRLEDGAMLAFNNVEMLAFANGDVTVLAHNHEEAVIGRAYELLLGRNVDTDGYAFWIAGIENGAQLHGTLDLMMQSPEYTGAALSNSAFLDLLYATGFDRTADAGGKAFWLAALDSGVSRAQVLEGFAASGEAVTVIGSTIDVTVIS